MQRYYHLVKQLLEHFEQMELIHVNKEWNDWADALAHLGSTKMSSQHRTFIQETLTSPTTDVTKSCSNQIDPSGWMSPIWAYLITDALPQEPVEARKVRCQASHYAIINNEMFKQAVLRPLLKYIRKDNTMYIMHEVHRGICGMHTRGWSMVKGSYELDTTSWP